MISIRTATASDVPQIYQFIRKKSEFDRHIGAFQGELQVTEAKLYQTLFVPIPFAYVLLADVVNEAVGFALYGFRYSSFAGLPSIWLDDLFVESSMRSQGVGTMLMGHLVQIAAQSQCTHLAWTADSRNHQGISFYERFGAQIIQQVGHRCWLRWSLPLAN